MKESLADDVAEHRQKQAYGMATNERTARGQQSKWNGATESYATSNALSNGHGTSQRNAAKRIRSPKFCDAPFQNVHMRREYTP